MKKLKYILKAIAGSIILLLTYLIYVADRIITSFTFKFQFGYKDWAELTKKEQIRTYTDVIYSTIRVSIILLIIWLVWALK